MNELDRRKILACANPACAFRVNPEPSLGGFCCTSCHSAWIQGTPLVHGPRCHQSKAAQWLPRAPPAAPTPGGFALPAPGVSPIPLVPAAPAMVSPVVVSPVVSPARIPIPAASSSAAMPKMRGSVAKRPMEGGPVPVVSKARGPVPLGTVPKAAASSVLGTGGLKGAWKNGWNGCNGAWEAQHMVQTWTEDLELMNFELEEDFWPGDPMGAEMGFYEDCQLWDAQLGWENSLEEPAISWVAPQLVAPKPKPKPRAAPKLRPARRGPPEPPEPELLEQLMEPEALEVDFEFQLDGCDFAETSTALVAPELTVPKAAALPDIMEVEPLEEESGSEALFQEASQPTVVSRSLDYAALREDAAARAEAAANVGLARLADVKYLRRNFRNRPPKGFAFVTDTCNETYCVCRKCLTVTGLPGSAPPSAGTAAAAVPPVPLEAQHQAAAVDMEAEMARLLAEINEVNGSSELPVGKPEPQFAVPLNGTLL